MNRLNINLATGVQLLTIWLPVNQIPIFADRVFDSWFFNYRFSFVALSTNIPSTISPSTTFSTTTIGWPANSMFDLQYLNYENGLHNSITMLLKI